MTASVTDAMRDRMSAVLGDELWAKALRAAAAVIAFVAVIELTFRLALNYFIQGVAIGSLYGILAVGIILIYRTNRIINFAAAAIGAVPAILALLLDVQRGVPYLVVAPIAIFGGLGVGALVDILVMRRFARAPRLIVTVVTLGVAQTMAAIGFFIPVWLGSRAGQIPNVPTPWDTFRIDNRLRQPVLTGNQVAALVTVVLLSVGLGVFLRYTRIGIALRASAENADRASLLGIPVKQVQTAAWMLAGLLGAMAIFVQSPLIGVPSNATLGFDSLLYALAAAVIGRMERLGVALVAGMGVGVIEFAVVAKTGKSEAAGALMLVVILGALLVQRKATARALDTGQSTWESVKQFRPIPMELRDLPEVQGVRTALFGLIVVVGVALPFIVGRAELPRLQLLPIYGIVGVSLVVLTGWAGQISLGQFGFVGVGAAASGGLAANHNIDFFVALFVGMAAGVIVAIIIGLPAVRIQGLYLAVTTLAFGYTVPGYLLNKNYFFGKRLLPKGLAASIQRPMLYGRINLENERTFYFVCLASLALAIACASAFRRNRSGRVLIAARDNQRAAPAYGINLTRTRLSAFAVSGGLAGMAGVLFAYAQHNVIPQSYSVLSSIVIFLAATIGGLTSLPFAVAGVIGLEVFTLFGSRLYSGLGQTFVAVVPLLLTGPLLVFNLLVSPGGSAQGAFDLRDRYLRWVANRHDILVPSLVADRLVEPGADESAVVDAELHYEEVEAASAAITSITCPSCGKVVALADAPHHEHFREPAGSRG